MAPNKKTVVTLIESLSHTDLSSMVVVDPKATTTFPPLTTGPILPATKPEAKAPGASPHTYWTWKADTNEEEVAQSLSGQAIEENLVRSSAQSMKEEMVGYWDEGTNNDDDDEPMNDSMDAGPKQQQSADYWSWSGPSSAVPNKDKLTSAAHIESNLIQASKILGAKSDVIRASSHDDSTDYWMERTPAKEDESNMVYAKDFVNRPQPNASYWEWPASKAEQDDMSPEKQAQAIEAMLSAEHIVKNVQQQANDLYWHQSEQEQESGESNDAYWTWKTDARQTAVAIAATEGYWEW